MPQG
jgi:hypothetical protein